MIIERTRLLMSPFMKMISALSIELYTLVIFRQFGASSIHAWNMTWRLNQQRVKVGNCIYFSVKPQTFHLLGSSTN